MKTELKLKHLAEIKSLEQEYLRNINRLTYIQEVQRDITSRIQIILEKF